MTPYYVNITAEHRSVAAIALNLPSETKTYLGEFRMELARMIAHRDLTRMGPTVYVAYSTIATAAKGA